MPHRIPSEQPKTRRANEYTVDNGLLGDRLGAVSSEMSAARLTSTRLGRVLLHAACLCRRPAAAGFFLRGVRRELHEWRCDRERSHSR